MTLAEVKLNSIVVELGPASFLFIVAN